MVNESKGTISDVVKLDIRVARGLTAKPLVGARKPAFAMSLDCGPDLGTRTSSAQLTDAYTAGDLVGRVVLAVVNLPPRRVAGFESQVLTLGVYTDAGRGPVALVSPDPLPTLRPGDRLG